MPCARVRRPTFASLALGLLFAAGCDKGEEGTATPNDDPVLPEEGRDEVESPVEEDVEEATGDEVSSASPWIDIHNGCTDPVGYCVKHPDGRETQTSMNGSSHQAYQIAPGGAVRSRDENGRCDAVLFEVSAETGDSDFYLCKS